jgi:hypothetical protein
MFVAAFIRASARLRLFSTLLFARLLARLCHPRFVCDRLFLPNRATWRPIPQYESANFRLFLASIASIPDKYGTERLGSGNGPDRVATQVWRTALRSVLLNGFRDSSHGTP